MSSDPQAKHVTFPRWRVVISLVWLLSLTTVGLVLTGFWHVGAFDHNLMLEFPQFPDEDDWQFFEPDGYGCKIELPDFECEVVICTGFNGFPQQYATRREQPFESFGIAAMKYENDATGKPLETQLRDVFGPFEQQSIGLKFATEESFQFGDYPALQRTYTIPKHGNVVGRAVLVGDRHYLLLAAGKDFTASDPRVKRFLESLTVTDPALLQSAKALRAKPPAPDAAVTEPDLLHPDSGVPTPALYLPFDTVGDESTPEAITKRAVFVHANATPIDSPTGKGLNITLTPQQAAVDLSSFTEAFRFTMNQEPEQRDYATYSVAGWVRTSGNDVKILKGGEITIRVLGEKLLVSLSNADGAANMFITARPDRAEWFHFVLTRGEDTSHKFYVNGTAVQPVFDPVRSKHGSWSTVKLGVISTGTAECAFDEFAVFHTELSDTDVKILASKK